MQVVLNTWGRLYGESWEMMVWGGVGWGDKGMGKGSSIVEGGR